MRPRIVQPEPYAWKAMNSPGNPARSGTRAPAIFNEGPARPRKLGHVLYTTPDFEASMRFLTDVLGFKISDTSAGMIAFLRCSTDHHNVGLINAPVPFFHHSSWQVNDLDEIGQGAQTLLAVDPTPRHLGPRPALPRQQPVLVLPRPGRQLRRVLRRPRSDPRRRRVGCSRLGARQVAVRVGSARSQSVRPPDDVEEIAAALQGVS